MCLIHVVKKDMSKVTTIWSQGRHVTLAPNKEEVERIR